MTTTAYLTQNAGLPKVHSSRPDGEHTACELKYLNEGGANFVFRILPIDSELPAYSRRRLLRLRKDLPDAQSTDDGIASFRKDFQPLFPGEHLVQQELVEVDSSLAAQLNEALNHVKRPTHRKQDILAVREPHGLMITDMTPAPDDILLQVKPKWLQQSPSAPEGARRCRTCALRVQRASKGIRTATDKQAACPLKLVSDRLDDRREAAAAITRDTVLQDYLSKDALTLLQTLRRHQANRDPKGVLAVSTEGEVKDLCKAMTLRDCTLFLRRTGDQVEARIADLDTKGSEKVSMWMRGERELVQGGWYGDQGEVEEGVCLLAQSGR